MTTRHHISHADEIYRGGVVFPGYNKAHDGRPGLLIAPQFRYQYGAISGADADGLVVDQSITGAGNLSMTGALVSSSVGTFATPRNLTITSTGNDSGLTFVVTGTDWYDEDLVENITGPNNSTVSGIKAFKTVTSIAVTGATASGVTIGSGTRIGLPLRLENSGFFGPLLVDGVSISGVTLVAGLAASGTSTATTADVRGTMVPDLAPNGTRKYTLVMEPDGTKQRTDVFGATQFGG